MTILRSVEFKKSPSDFSKIFLADRCDTVGKPLLVEDTGLVEHNPPLLFAHFDLDIPAAFLFLGRYGQAEKRIAGEFPENQHRPREACALAERFFADIHADAAPPDFRLLEDERIVLVPKGDFQRAPFFELADEIHLQSVA